MDASHRPLEDPATQALVQMTPGQFSPANTNFERSNYRSMSLFTLGGNPSTTTTFAFGSVTRSGSRPKPTNYLIEIEGTLGRISVNSLSNLLYVCGNRPTTGPNDPGSRVDR